MKTNDRWESGGRSGARSFHYTKASAADLEESVVKFNRASSVSFGARLSPFRLSYQQAACGPPHESHAAAITVNTICPCSRVARTNWGISFRREDPSRYGLVKKRDASPLGSLRPASRCAAFPCVAHERGFAIQILAAFDRKRAKMFLLPLNSDRLARFELERLRMPLSRGAFSIGKRAHPVPVAGVTPSAVVERQLFSYGYAMRAQR